jgi:type IV secretion system protein TrbL
MEFNALTTALGDLSKVLDKGAGLVLPYALTLLATIILLEVVITGSLTAVGEYGAGGLLRKALLLGGWWYLTKNFNVVAVAFVDSLSQAGLIAGGKGHLKPGVLLDPSRIAGMGLDATEPILQNFDTASLLLIGSLWRGGAGDVLKLVFVFGVSWVLMIGIYFLIAVVVFLTVLEFHLALAVDGLLVPFGAWGPTRMIAEKAIGSVVSVGVKMMTLSLILAASGPFLEQSIRRLIESTERTGGTITINAVLGSLLTAIAVGFLSWFGPRWAGQRAGSISLAGLSEVKSAATTGAAAGAAVVTGGASAAISATKAATSGIAYTAGAMSSGARMGSATSSEGALSRFAGGMAGAARAGAGAVGHGISSALHRNSGGAPGPSAFARGAMAALGRPTGPVVAASIGPPGARDLKDLLPLNPSRRAGPETWSAAAGGYVPDPGPKPPDLGGNKPIIVGAENGNGRRKEEPALCLQPPGARVPVSTSSTENGAAAPAAGSNGHTSAGSASPPPAGGSIAPPRPIQPAVVSPPAWSRGGAAGGPANGRRSQKKPPLA